MGKVYGIIFNDGGKVYYFKANFSCPLNVTVIVSTEKGEQFGKITSEIIDDEKLKKFTNLKDVIRIATKDDYNKHLQNLKDSDRALKKCKELVSELNLKMKIVNSSFTFDKSQLLFNFLADERIDFRELAKKLASIYRTRIELRQIGARDKAKEISGIGICGQKLCCANFLNSMETVTINMAKNQNLALNPNKINGQCNRLLCCLAYEDDNYTCSKRDLPYIGQKIKTRDGEGIVTSINVLNKTYSVNVNNSILEISIENEK